MNADSADTTPALTELECLVIIRKSLRLPANQGIHLKWHKVERASSDLVGFMGEYFKLEVTFTLENLKNVEQSRSYFIKSVPISNQYNRDECLQKGVFTKEPLIYNDILSNIQRYASSKLFPECYYTRDDILVLEDLSVPPESLRHEPDNGNYTLKHHKIVLRHLAMMHAASIAWEINEGVNIGKLYKNVLVEQQLSVQSEWYVTGVKGVQFLATCHEDFQDPYVKKQVDDLLKNTLYNVEEMTQPSPVHQNVFCHRDCWNQNIFFKYDDAGDPIGCCIVDFQLCRYSRPAIDVLYYLYVNTPAQLRSLIYEECLRFYHNCLLENLEKLQLPQDLIPWEEFTIDCQQTQLAVLILWAICEPLMKVPKGMLNEMRTENPQQFHQYMNVDRSGFFRKIMAVDPQYKEFIMQPISELLNYLLNNKK